MKLTYFFSIIFILFSCKKRQDLASNNERKPIEKINLKKDLSNKHDKMDILKLFLDEEIKEEKYDQISYKDYTVHFPNEGDAYSVSFQKIGEGDFNNDHITDFVVKRVSEGMLGGNVNTEAGVYFVIMDAKKIREKHEICLYAPFSYNIVDIESFANNQLKAVATQNKRVYYESEDVESTPLVFEYKNGNVYEKSYLMDCSLAKWKNKKIFRLNPSHRFKSIDMHNYTETVTEKYTDSERKIEVELSGCDNLNATFNIQLNKKFNELNAPEVIHQTTLETLEFLKSNTNFTTELDKIIAFYRNEKKENKDFIKLKNLSFRILIDEESVKNKKINFILNIDKISNPNQTENWGIATRIK